MKTVQLSLAGIAALILVGVACGTDEPRSTLQVRPVMEDRADDCQSTQANPNPSTDARLPDRDGRCYALEPAALVVERANVQRAPQAEGDLILILGDSDADTFLSITESHVRKRLALVMFGTVLAAPVVQEPIQGGGVSLNGLSPELADRVESSLSR